MVDLSPEFVAGMLDEKRVSRDRVALALAVARPDALTWCDESCSSVSRTRLVESLIASLAPALRLRWSEVLLRSRRLARASCEWPVTARFNPAVDVFDGARATLAVTLSVHVGLALFAVDSPRASTKALATLRLGIGFNVRDADFHEITRELVLPRL